MITNGNSSITKGFGVGAEGNGAHAGGLSTIFGSDRRTHRDGTISNRPGTIAAPWSITSSSSINTI